MDDFATTGDYGSRSDRVVLQPDASMLNAVGRGHSLASALADLIDNSLDAGADEVSIQFVVKDSMIRSIRIIDDGCGMTAAQLSDAMTLGKRRAYGAKSLGHFGVGLQGASLSQAGVVSVYSSAGHAPAAGMRLAKAQSGPAIEVDVFDSETVDAILRRRGITGASGTLVEWTHLEAVSVASTVQERRRWIESTILRIRDELGLVFHRFLADGRIRIWLSELDESTNETGAPRTVKAVDPLGFDRWGANDYPRDLKVSLPTGGELVASCYVLAPGVDSSLLGRSRRDRQGLYVYRNDRLLHAGGWLGFNQDLPADLQLGRVVIDVTDDVLDAIVINPEKTGVVLRPAAVQGLERTVTKGLTLRAFWDVCREIWNESKRRDLNAKPFAQLGDGAPTELNTIMERTVGVREDSSVSLSFDWRELEYAQLFAFDPPTGTVWLNEQHRIRLERDASHLTSIKTSLFFLLELHVGKERLGAATAERLDAMQAAFATNVIPVQPLSRPDLPQIGGPVRLPRSVVERPDLDEPLGDPRVAHVHVSPDALDDFMRRMRQTELLDAQEEVELGSLIEVGLFASERLLTDYGGRAVDQAMLDLAWLERDGIRARDRMVVSNLRLVVSIAKRYLYNGLELADLVQEGILGLIHAVEMFDHRQGTKFSTYATWWIRQSITRATADRGRMIRFPVHVVEKLPEIKRQWSETTGSATQRIHAVARERSDSVSAIRGILNNLEEPLSLDAPIAVRIDSGAWLPVPFAEVLQDNESVGPEEWIERLATRLQVDELLRTLTGREEEVIRRRFGFDDGLPRTLDQIGDTFGVTRERIRQIEKKAMESLRRSVGADGGNSLGAGVKGSHEMSRARRKSRQPVAPQATSLASTSVLANATANGQQPSFDALSPELVRPTDVLLIDDWPKVVQALGLYGDGWHTRDIANAIDVSTRDVAVVLAWCVFGLREDATQMHAITGDDAPLSEAERTRIVEEAEAGTSFMSLAQSMGRSPIAVVWAILDGPNRPRLTRKMLAAVRPVAPSAGALTQR